jgi:hypothetical protein
MTIKLQAPTLLTYLFEILLLQESLRTSGNKAFYIFFGSVKFRREVHFAISKAKTNPKYDYSDSLMIRKTKVVLGERAACLEIVHMADQIKQE